MNEKIEPGYYWVRLTDDPDDVEMVVVDLNGTIDVVRPLFGPKLTSLPMGAVRIPFIEELGEWKTDDELRCNACGSPNLAWYRKRDDSYAFWHCADCGNDLITEARFRVVEEG